MQVMGSISDRAEDPTVSPGLRNHKFMGKDEPNTVKPERISLEIERHRALARVSLGSILASGTFTFGYSVMAIVSHTIAPAWIRQVLRSTTHAREAHLWPLDH